MGCGWVTGGHVVGVPFLHRAQGVPCAYISWLGRTDGCLRRYYSYLWSVLGVAATSFSSGVSWVLMAKRGGFGLAGDKVSFEAWTLEQGRFLEFEGFNPRAKTFSWGLGGIICTACVYDPG